MKNENYYEILNIEKDASPDEIKKAYRKLSLKYHPDKNPDPQSSQMFHKISEAYDILYDNQKRQNYDFQHKFSKTTMPGQQESINMNDLFQNLFGNQNVNLFNDSGLFCGNHIFNQLQKPVPIIKSINVDFKTTYYKQTIPVEIERSIVDQHSKTFEKEKIYIEIEEGIDEDELIIIREKGNINHLNIQGDIKIFVKIENNTDFVRNGLNLELRKKITLKDALCGFSFEINHINGRIYKIKNEIGNIIAPNYTKTIPNLGIKRKDQLGVLNISFDIIFPNNLPVDKLAKIKDIL